MAAVSVRLRFGPLPSSRVPRVLRDDSIWCFADFYDTGTGAAVEASGVAARARLPNGDYIDPAPTPEDMGDGTVWGVQVIPEYAGQWYIEVSCTSPDEAIATAAFIVTEREPGTPLPASVGAQPLNSRLTSLAASSAESGLAEFSGPTGLTSRALGVGASTSVPTAADLVAQNIATISDMTDAVARDVRARLRDTVHAEDFGAYGEDTNDDADAFMAALTACADSGRVLRLRAGRTYRVRAVIDFNGKDGWGIVGEPGSVISRKGLGFQLMSLVDCDDVTFHGVEFNGRVSGGSAEARIELYNCQRVTFDLCRFDFLRGIEVEGGTSQIKITNCRYYETYIAMQLGETVTESSWPNSSECLFANNIVIGTAQEAIEGNKRYDKIIIANNIFLDCNTVANEEVIDAGGTNTAELVIIGNTFINDGAFFPAAAGPTRQVFVKTASGGAPQNTIIANNRFSGVGSDTDNCSLVVDTVPHVLVVGNAVTGGYDGIRVAASPDAVIVGNTVEEPAFRGIYLNNATGGTVAGNAIESNIQYGIVVNNGVGFSATGNTIRGTPTEAIRISGSSSASGAITGNTITGATSYGINIPAGSRMSVVGNVMENCARGIENRAINSAIVGNVMEGTGANIGLLLHATGTNSRAVGNTVEGFLVGIDIQAIGSIVTGNHSLNQVAGATSCGFRIGASVTDAIITSNRATDTQGTKTQAYGLRVTAGCDYIILRDNNFRGNGTGGVQNLASLGANSQGSASDNIGTA